LAAAGIAHRRIYDLRHTYATWSLPAGIDVYTLARRMGTSLLMIDRTYGHGAVVRMTTSASSWMRSPPGVPAAMALFGR
jgi:integrase